MGSLRQLFWQQRMERRELTDAAKVIQNAYRMYKRKAQTRQRQLEVECKAAVVIQTYYRRYKQYCYSKKLHQAAALIQRQFRLYKSTKRKSDQDSQDKRSDNIDSTNEQPLIAAFTEFLENTAKAEVCMPEHHKDESNEGLCCSSCSADDEYWDEKRQKAAMRIQQAFRGHRKRQAAAAGPARKHRRLSATSLSIRQESMSPVLQP